jgi:hypothetical protein
MLGSRSSAYFVRGSLNTAWIEVEKRIAAVKPRLSEPARFGPEEPFEQDPIDPAAEPLSTLDNHDGDALAIPLDQGLVLIDVDRANRE